MFNKEIIIKRASKEGFLYFIYKVTATILYAIASIIIARYLEPEYYGIYSLLITIPHIYLLLGGLGIEPALIKFISSEYVLGRIDKIRYMLNITLLFKFLIYSLLFVISALLATQVPYTFHLDNTFTMLLYISGLLIIIEGIHNIFYGVLRALEKASKAGFLEVINAITRLVLALLFITVLQLRVLGAVLSYIAGFLAALIVGIILCYKWINHLRKELELFSEREVSNGAISLIKSMISYGFIVYLYGVTHIIIDYYDRIILVLLTSSRELGGFSVIVNITLLPALLVRSISFVMFPVFSMYNTISKDTSPFILSLSIRFSTLILMPIIASIIIYSQKIVNLIYGSAYTFASFYLVLYSIDLILLPFIQLTISYLKGCALLRDLLKMTVTSLILNIILSPILGIFLRVPGIILAKIISDFIVLLYVVLYIYRKNHISIGFKSLSLTYLLTLFLSILIIGINKILSTYIGDFALVVSIILLLLLYINAIGLLRCINKIEFIYLEKILCEIPILGKLLVIILKYLKTTFY